MRTAQPARCAGAESDEEQGRHQTDPHGWKGRRGRADESADRPAACRRCSAPSDQPGGDADEPMTGAEARTATPTCHQRPPEPGTDVREERPRRGASVSSDRSRVTSAMPRAATATAAMCSSVEK